MADKDKEPTDVDETDKTLAIVEKKCETVPDKPPIIRFPCCPIRKNYSSYLREQNLTNRIA